VDLRVRDEMRLKLDAPALELHRVQTMLSAGHSFQGFCGFFVSFSGFLCKQMKAYIYELQSHWSDGPGVAARLESSPLSRVTPSQATGRRSSLSARPHWGSPSSAEWVLSQVHLQGIKGQTPWKDLKRTQISCGSWRQAELLETDFWQQYTELVLNNAPFMPLCRTSTKT